MPKGSIFISYRRGTDGNAARLLYDKLSDEFGEDRLFFDIDSIPMGIDFHDYLNEQVAECDVFVAIIGPSWIAATDRLQSEDDFVRIEIEAALERKGIPVIPLLVDGAQMPADQDLPPAIAKLTRRNGIQVYQRHFDLIVENELIPALRSELGDPIVAPSVVPTPPKDQESKPSTPPQTGGRNIGWKIGGALAALGAVAIGVFVAMPGPDPDIGGSQIGIGTDKEIEGKTDPEVGEVGTRLTQTDAEIGAETPRVTQSSVKVKTLLKQISDGSTSSSADAVKALGAMGPEIVPAILQTLRNPAVKLSIDSRAGMLTAMASMMKTHPGQRPEVSKMLSDEDIDSFVKGTTLKSGKIRKPSMVFLAALRDARTLDAALTHWKRLSPQQTNAYLQLANLMLTLAPHLPEEQAIKARRILPTLQGKGQGPDAALTKAMKALPS